MRSQPAPPSKPLLLLPLAMLHSLRLRLPSLSKPPPSSPFTLPKYSHVPSGSASRTASASSAVFPVLLLNTIEKPLPLIPALPSVTSASACLSKQNRLRIDSIPRQASGAASRAILPKTQKPARGIPSAGFLPAVVCSGHLALRPLNVRHPPQKRKKPAGKSPPRASQSRPTASSSRPAICRRSPAP